MTEGCDGRCDGSMNQREAGLVRGLGFGINETRSCYRWLQVVSSLLLSLLSSSLSRQAGLCWEWGGGEPKGVALEWHLRAAYISLRGLRERRVASRPATPGRHLASALAPDYTSPQLLLPRLPRTSRKSVLLCHVLKFRCSSGTTALLRN